MTQRRKYIVVEGSDIKLFREKVSRRISANWIAQGGVSVANVSTRGAFGLWYSQALVSVDKEQEE